MSSAVGWVRSSTGLTNNNLHQQHSTTTATQPTTALAMPPARRSTRAAPTSASRESAKPYTRTNTRRSGSPSAQSPAASVSRTPPGGKNSLKLTVKAAPSKLRQAISGSQLPPNPYTDEASESDATPKPSSRTARATRNPRTVVEQDSAAAASVSFAICLTLLAPSDIPGSSTSKGSNPIARIPSRLKMFSFLAPWFSCAFSSSYRYPSPLKSLGGFASRKLCREARSESILYGDNGVQAL